MAMDGYRAEINGATLPRRREDRTWGRRVVNFFLGELDQAHAVGLIVVMVMMCIEGLIGMGFSIAEDFRAVGLRSDPFDPSLAANAKSVQEKGLRRAARKEEPAMAPSSSMPPPMRRPHLQDVFTRMP